MKIEITLESITISVTKFNTATIFILHGNNTSVKPGGRGRRRCLRLCLGGEVVVAKLPGDLIEAGAGHGGVDAEEIPVPGFDDEAVPGPDDPGDGNHRLLRVGQRLRRLGEVGDVGDAQPPLEGGRPEVDCLRPRRVVPQRPELRIHLIPEQGSGDLL